jgi:hypothetical protein
MIRVQAIGSNAAFQNIASDAESSQILRLRFEAIANDAGTLTAIRRASSFVSSLAADRRPGSSLKVTDAFAVKLRGVLENVSRYLAGTRCP